MIIVIETDESSDQEWRFQPRSYNLRSKRTNCPCSELHKLEHSKLQQKLKRTKDRLRQLQKQNQVIVQRMKTLESKLDKITERARNAEHDSFQKIILLQAKLIKSYEANRNLEDKL